MNIHSSLQFNAKPLIITKNYFGINSSPNINLNFNRKIKHKQRQTMVDPFQTQDQTIIRQSKSRNSDVTEFIKKNQIRPASELLLNNRHDRRTSPISQHKKQIKKIVQNQEQYQIHEEQVKLVIKDEWQFQQKIFYWRTQTHFPVIKVNLIETNQIKFQQQDYLELKLRIDREQNIKFRLNDIKQFNLLNFIYIVNEALVGFQRLFNEFGFFQPTSSMIFITNIGKCKVWHNENIWENKPITQISTKVKTKQIAQNYYLRLIQIFSNHFKRQISMQKEKQRSIKLIQKLLLQLQKKPNLVLGLKFINEFLLSYRLKLNNRYFFYTQKEKNQLDDLRNRLSSKFQSVFNQSNNQQYNKNPLFGNSIKKVQNISKQKEKIWTRKNSDNSQTKNNKNQEKNNITISINKMKYSESKIKYVKNKLKTSGNSNSPVKNNKVAKKYQTKQKPVMNLYKKTDNNIAIDQKKQTFFKNDFNQNNQQKQIDFKRRSQISCSSKQTIPYKQRFSIQGGKQISKTDRFNDSQFTKKNHFPCFGKDNSDKNSDIQGEFQQNQKQTLNFQLITSQFLNKKSNNQNSPTLSQRMKNRLESHEQQNEEIKNKIQKQIRFKNGWMENTLNLLIQQESMKNSFQDSQPSVNMNYIRDRALTKLNRIKKSIANSIVQSNNNY